MLQFSQDIDIYESLTPMINKNAMTQQKKQESYGHWFIGEVEKGLADIDSGEVLTEEEADAHMEKFFDSLAKEAPQAA